MRFRATQDFNDGPQTYKAGQEYDQADANKVRQWINEGKASAMPGGAVGAMGTEGAGASGQVGRQQSSQQDAQRRDRANSERAQADQQKRQQSGGEAVVSDDGKTTTLPDGSRGSVGAQQVQPEKGAQVREGVSGQPTAPQAQPDAERQNAQNQQQRNQDTKR